jgi:hypothetical protein
MRDERDQAPETAPGGPRGSAVAPLSASGECAPVHHPSLFSSPHLRVARGPYGADPDVVIDSRLHSAERPLPACEIRRLFRSVQTLEKCSRTARNCKKLQRKRIVETASSQETHAVCRFAIVGSDLQYTISQAQDGALQSMVERAMRNHPSCSLAAARHQVSVVRRETDAAPLIYWCGTQRPRNPKRPCAILGPGAYQQGKRLRGSAGASHSRDRGNLVGAA